MESEASKQIFARASSIKATNSEQEIVTITVQNDIHFSGVKK
jgi:hypothetical protein